jgi:putative DNA methylase
VRAVHADVVADGKKAGLKDDDQALEEGGTGARAYADAVVAILGLCVGKMAQSNSIVGRWFIDPRNGSGKATPAFERHAIPMVWDFVESNPFGGSVGDWLGPVLETVLRGFDLYAANSNAAVVSQRDARNVAGSLPAAAMLATDPPYYANIGYADLSDFFYLWLREALRPSFPKLFTTVATPKTDELIATPHRHAGDTEKAKEYFRTGFADVFGSISTRTDPRFPVIIMYAIKQAEESEGGVRSTGWEVFLGGLLDAGFSVVATWPMRTTTDTRMIGIGTNALASAIVVIGRRRAEDAPKLSRAQFIRELRSELPAALACLRAANIAPVDMAQAAIGPGMAVFSRCSSVIEADGKRVSVGEALGLINQAVDEALAQHDSDFDADSRWALTWFEQLGFAEGEYGVADQLSKSKNTSVGGMVEASIVASKGGKVRLLKPDELPKDWDPAKDHRLTVWEMVHQLIRALDKGEAAAAAVLAKLGTKAEVARELAYRLYTICERKKRAQEALSYNALVQSWPEIVRLAGERVTPQEAELF